MESARRYPGGRRRAFSYCCELRLEPVSTTTDHITPDYSLRKRIRQGVSSCRLFRDHPAVTLLLTVWKGVGMLIIISEMKNPALSAVISLIHMDLGVPAPGPGHYVIPGECAPYLDCLETAASLLSKVDPAPEDADASRDLLAGEAPRYLDSEMTALVLGEPQLAEAVARRIPGGFRLLTTVDCVRKYLEEENTRERTLGGDGI